MRRRVSSVMGHTEARLRRQSNAQPRYGCVNLIVETGHFPMWPLIETRRPCTSSSQTFSTVPAFPSVRTTALPTSSDRAASSAPRIVNAWTFAVGMATSEIRPRARGVCIERCTSGDCSAMRIGAASLGIEGPELRWADAAAKPALLLCNADDRDGVGIVRIIRAVLKLNTIQ